MMQGLRKQGQSMQDFLQSTHVGHCKIMTKTLRRSNALPPHTVNAFLIFNSWTTQLAHEIFLLGTTVLLLQLVFPH